MPERFIPGGTKILKSQDGNILIIGVFLILFICVLFAGMVEFGRVMIVREQLQTAADAAGLAAAGSGTHRYVTINVITDLGPEKICEEDEDGKSYCWCEDCGTVPPIKIVGNEVDLLDKGGWKQYCVPRCGGCDGSRGDCWYQLVDRELTYDTHSMSWGTEAENINNIEKQLTSTTRQIIPYFSYDNRNSISRMMEGLSLQSMDRLLNNSNYWLSSWMRVGGYYNECPESNFNPSIGWECRQWQAKGMEAYHSIKNKSIAGEFIKTLTDMRQHNTNLKKTPGIDAQYTGAAGQFFNVNLPANAEASGITKLEVYGYDRKDSPYYPSVVVYATSHIKSLFPQWFKKDYKPGDDFYFTTNVCAQGISSYRDAEDQTRSLGRLKGPLSGGKWSKVPAEACWQD